MTLDDRSASSEREREALEFMRRGRRLRGFTPTQIRRVERRLMESQRPVRRRVWLPRLAVVCLALLAGSAVAAVLDLAQVPLISSLLPSSKSADTSKLRRARPTSKPSRPAVAPIELKPADVPSVPTSTPNPLLPGASAPEAPPSPLPSSQPPRTIGTRASAERSVPLPQRLAARAQEAPSPRSNLQSFGSTGNTKPAATGPDTMPAAHRAPVEPAPAIAPRPTPTTPTTPTAANTPAPQPEDPVLAESRSFSAAVGRWHLDHDAKAALAALDAHQRRFPGGRLSLEATLLRAEILLQAGREQEVLRLLDGVSLEGLPRGRELQTVRGELRIKHGRCADGRRDLDEVLAKDASDSFGRRASHAISACRL